MALTSAIALGPIAYFAQGQQVLIPVPAFGFNAAGDIEFVEPIPPYPAAALLWLEQLRQWGYIRPATKPAPKVAMAIQAVDPGELGNQIIVTFTRSGSTFDMEVTASTTYTDVSPSQLKTLLGTETQPGSQPGLVRLLDADLPLQLPEPIADVVLTGGNDAANVPAPATTVDAIKQAANPAQTAFRLIARKPGSGGNKIKITITQGPSAGNFSLVTTWHHPKTGLNAGSLTTINNEFGYILTVAAPPGDIFAVPDTGTISLAGGTNAGKASASPVTP